MLGSTNRYYIFPYCTRKNSVFIIVFLKHNPKWSVVLLNKSSVVHDYKKVENCCPKCFYLSLILDQKFHSNIKAKNIKLDFLNPS